MQHWRQVLSLPILQLEYEALVAEPREQVSRLLDFLELDWEEQCLKFDQSKRTTLTASNAQVKKKVYDSSAGRWKNDANVFGNLRDQVYRTSGHTKHVGSESESVS